MAAPAAAAPSPLYLLYCPMILFGIMLFGIVSTVYNVSPLLPNDAVGIMISHINHKPAKSINGSVGYHSPPNKLLVAIYYGSSKVCICYMQEKGEQGT